MRGLLLNDEIRAKVKAQSAWADQRENWYMADKDQQAPGDNPAYTMMLEVGFRVVYTQTVLKGKHYRHLSVSVTGKKYPHELAVFTIATMFGFTGGEEKDGVTIKPGKWQMDVNKVYRCIVLAQEI